MLFKKRIIFCSIIFLALFTACSGKTVEKKIYNHLEEAVALEQEFEQQQAEITDLEKKEQTIFNQIITIDEHDLDEVKQLSEQAIDIIEGRFDKVKVEEESIQLAKEEFNKIKDLIESLPEEQAKEKANEMYITMMDRYELYESLNEEYVKSLQLEEELYTLLPGEDIEQEDVSSQIEKINESYTVVLDLNEQFNEKTVEYNGLKEKFYNAANINVNYKKD